MGKSEKKMRCLSCEIHVLYRVVLRFSREAVLAMRHTKTLEKLADVNSYRRCGITPATRVDVALVSQEVPLLSPRSMKGAVYIFIVDKHMPDATRRSVKRFGKHIAGLIDCDDLDEGFIEINEYSDTIQLAEP